LEYIILHFLSPIIIVVVVIVVVVVVVIVVIVVVVVVVYIYVSRNHCSRGYNYCEGLQLTGYLKYPKFSVSRCLKYIKKQ
jgi:hypothetical protein